MTLAEVLPALQARGDVLSLDVFGMIGVASLLADAVDIVLAPLLSEAVAVGAVLAQADRITAQIAITMLKIVFGFISFSISKDEMEYICLIFGACEGDMSFL